MVKKSVSFTCQNCGHITQSWLGKCPSCGEWNTLVENFETSGKASTHSHSLSPKSVGYLSQSKSTERIPLSVSDINTVLGGGIVPGSLILLGGQPGIGKSTLLMQMAALVADTSLSILYISGEESSEQVALRAHRLGIKGETVQIASSTSADDIIATILSRKYSLVVVDSVQTITLSEISSAAGSVSQITNVTYGLMNAAKTSGTAVILVGHVTKEGTIAGPKLLEHIVDVVLQLDGDRYGGFKVLRAIKNRFGSTNESALFEMQENGLCIVENPSAALLEERKASDGSVVFAGMEGARPLLVEVQALVTTSNYGYPKRTASGMDSNRLNLLIAVVEKRTKLKLSDKDIYINIVGGLKITEPALDLAVCVAIASATTGLSPKKDAVVFGEVGLSGEIRRCAHADKRLSEALKIGFGYAITPTDKSISNSQISALQCNELRSALKEFLL